MATASKAGLLSKYGARFIENGYRVVPILPGEKNPVEPNWQTTPASLEVLSRWLDPKYSHPTSGNRMRYAERAGAGIITEPNPAVDIDVLDEIVSAHMRQWVADRWGFDAPVRVGLAPKCLMLFRTDEPFRKLSSSKYIDAQGRKAQVEILGKGQQFVAAGIHQVTLKPYKWDDGRNPATVASADLPELREEHAREIIAEFERLATELKWERQTTRRDAPGTAVVGTRVGQVDRDNPFAADKAKTEISDEELHRKLLMVPNSHEYETWTNVGMALYHQFEGGERGLELWHEWSEQASNYDAATLDEKWPTFDASMKGREPLTARYIIKLADEEAAKIATETYADVIVRLKAAPDIAALREVCEAIRHVPFDIGLRMSLVGVVQARYKALSKEATGNATTLPISTARDWTRYENPEITETPHWLAPFLYVPSEECFFDTKTKQRYSHKAFNATFGRFCMTPREVLEGKAAPENLPADLAMNRFRIPVISRIIYLPGQDDTFYYEGKLVANSYRADTAAAIPDRLSNSDHRAMGLLHRHFEHLFPNERERELFKSWLAYIAATGQRVNYAVILVGAEGDGKSLFFKVMQAALGTSNTKTLDTQSLEEKFNGWAEGSQLVFVEELKLHGHNRFDVINRIKTVITNDTIDVRRMRTDTYNTINTASILAATNFGDALPLTENDSRYFVVNTRFNTKDQIDAFKSSEPAYYDELFAAIDEHPGAVRKYLLDAAKHPHFEFSPKKRAPASRGHRRMAAASRSEEAAELLEILSEPPAANLTRDILDPAALADELRKRGIEDVPLSKGMEKLLRTAGFDRLGKVWIDGKTHNLWSRRPDRYLREDGKPDPDAIRDYLSSDTFDL